MTAQARRSKELDMPAAVALMREHLALEPTLALGGLFKQNRPVALVRELVRAAIGGLTLYSSPGSGYDVDLLVAAGLVREAFLPAVTLEHRLCPAFRGAVERGELSAPPCDALSIIGGLMAAAHGIPFHPIDAWRGSDVIAHNPLAREMVSPFDGSVLHAVAAIKPRVALLHAQEADEYGNVRHLSTMTYADHTIARAAEVVIVSVDRIVPNETVLRDPKATTIPCIYVDAVVEVPFGAHPTASFPLYAMDEEHIDLYADAAEEARKLGGSGATLDAYFARYVRGPRDHFAYLDEVGGLRRLAALEREARFV